MTTTIIRHTPDVLRSPCVLLSLPLATGGVSMGDRDLLKPLLQRKGSVHFGRVLMKPGKPLTFATLDLQDGRKLLVFGLPGASC